LFPSSPYPPAGPAATASGWLALLLLDQRERWERGERALVETYLQQHPNLASDVNALLDLIYNEVFLREQQGEAPRLEEYAGRFPELAEPLRLQFEVHAAIGTQTLPGTLVAGADPLAPEVSELPGPGGYQLIAELGRGQMGVVYKAWDPALKRFVALKVVRDGSHAGPEERARFRAEAEAAARLQHPHIVQIHAIGEQDGLPYLALEFVAGGTLKQQLAGKPLPAGEAAQLVETLARAPCNRECP
jgi:serine/threonine-protein kinase